MSFGLVGRTDTWLPLSCTATKTPVELTFCIVVTEYGPAAGFVREYDNPSVSDGRGVRFVAFPLPRRYIGVGGFGEMP